MIDTQHPEEQPFQPVRRVRGSGWVNEVLQKGDIVGIQDSGGFMQLCLRRAGLLGKVWDGFVR